MGLSIGIDVAKHTLEWAAGSEGKVQHARNEPRPIAGLVRRLVSEPSRSLLNHAILAAHRLMMGSILVLMNISISPVSDVGGIKSPFF